MFHTSTVSASALADTETLLLWEPTPPDFRHPTLSANDLENIRQTAALFLQGNLPGCDFAFDATEWSLHDLYAISLGMLLSCRTNQFLNLTWIELLNFVIDVETGYQMNPYHSFKHAVDVSFVLHFMLFSLNVSRFFAGIDCCVLLISAFCHDLAHPGLNNLYQVNGKTDLAILYNDVSVLENYSCSQSQSLLRKHAFLRNLSEQDSQYFSSAVNILILSTDMTCHFQLLTEFSNMVNQLSQQDVGHETLIELPLLPKNRLILLKMLLHGADISNPCRPWKVCKKWSDMVVEEFFLQGDVERKNGLPISPNMDRNLSNQVQISLGFGDFIVSPFFKSVSTLMPEFRLCVDSLDKNRNHWLDIKAKYEQEKASASVPLSQTSTASDSPNFPMIDTLPSSSVVFGKDEDVATSSSLYSLEHPETAQVSNLRASLKGRRLSVAAGVITIPEDIHHEFSLPPSHKISFEYMDRRGSNSNSSIRHSTSNSQSIMRLNSSERTNLVATEPYQATGMIKDSSEASILLASESSGSLQSSTTSVASYTQRLTSRRASAISVVDEESGLLKFVMRRRSSHGPVSGAQTTSATFPLGSGDAKNITSKAPHSTDQSSTRSTSATKGRGRWAKSAYEMQGMTLSSQNSIDSATEHDTMAPHYMDADGAMASTMQVIKERESRLLSKELPLSPLLVARSYSQASLNQDNEREPPQPIGRASTSEDAEPDILRLSKPQNFLHKVAVSFASSTIKNMMERNQISSMLSAPSSRIHREPNESAYLTIHRSDKIYDHIRPSILSDDMFQDTSAYSAHAGIVETKARPSALVGPVNANGDQRRQNPAKFKISKSAAALFDHIAGNMGGMALSRRLRAKSDLLLLNVHRRTASDSNLDD